MEKSKVIIEIKKGLFIGATSTNPNQEVFVVDHDLEPEQRRSDITTPVEVKIVEEEEFESIKSDMWHQVNH
ncbi:MAG: hypothetical protein ABJH04_08190 [Cyclobacteriaceae bacterium]